MNAIPAINSSTIRSGVQGLESYQTRYKTKKGNLHKKYVDFYNTLSEFGNSSNEDGIQKLSHLYYEQGKSVEDCYDALYKKGEEEKKKRKSGSENLRKNMISILKWSLRKANTRTAFGKEKRLKTLNTTGCQNYYTKKAQEAKNLFNEEILYVLLSNQSKQTFSEEIFNQKKRSFHKLIYILSCELGETETSVKEKVLNFSETKGTKYLTRELQENFSDFFEQNNFNFTYNIFSKETQKRKRKAA